MILALSIAGWVGASSCASNSPAAPASGTSKTLSEQLSQAFCDWQTACGGQNSDAGSTGGAAPDGGASADCLARAELAAEQQLALLATAYGEGLLTINVAVSKTCTAAYQARTCGGAADLNVDEALAGTACEGIFAGNIPVGERCDMTAECVAGTYCLSQATGKAITSVTGGGTLGVCFRYQQQGETCNVDGDCLPPLTCSPATFVCQ